MIFWEIIIEFWLSNKKVILTLKKIERWVFVCERESVFSHLLAAGALLHSLCHAAFAVMERTGRERNKPLPPRRRVSTLALSVLFFLFSTSLCPPVISLWASVAVFIASRCERRGRDNGAQVPRASMKSLQHRDD